MLKFNYGVNKERIVPGKVIIKSKSHFEIRLFLLVA